MYERFGVAGGLYFQPPANVITKASVLQPGGMGRRPTALLVILHCDRMSPRAQRLLQRVLRGSLIVPAIQNQLPVDIQAHAVRRQGGERVGALGEVEVALPSHRVGAPADGSVGRVATPIEVDLRI